MPDRTSAEEWYEIVTTHFGRGEHELAREAFATFDRRADEWPQGRRHAEWLRPWITADPGSPSAPSPGRPVVAIMDYAHPGIDRASANIGDHVQSIAGMAHLVRHRGLRLHGHADLTGTLETLRARTTTEFARDDLDADLEVMTVHRDASMYQPIPEGTWVLCFGWYMHALFEQRFGFPLHRNLRPLFVSFHCNKRELLTEEAVEYLRRYSPVGCRDWTTVHLLASRGIPAFFSGCLTTTIDGLFAPADPPPPAAPVAYVDVPAEPGGVAYEHSSPAVRQRPFLENVAIALERLETYRRAHARVVTSRLHCHLPLRAIGVDTEFRPENPADPRYPGLIGIDDEAFDRMRRGIGDKLERMLRMIVAAAPEDDVYDEWRRLTAADVAAAEQERRRPLPPAVPEWDERVRAARAAIVTHTPPPAGAIHCVVEEPDVVAALPRAGRPRHVWHIGPPREGAALAARFPAITFSSIPRASLPRRLRRTVLPELLPEVARAIVLWRPADVDRLAELDLGGHAIAAPLRPGPASGFGVINRAANRLRDRTAAYELRRTALARHAFDFDAFSADVLVLDLARLRQEGFTPAALALAEAFALGDVEVLHLMAGPNRATIC